MSIHLFNEFLRSTTVLTPLPGEEAIWPSGKTRNRVGEYIMTMKVPGAAAKPEDNDESIAEEFQLAAAGPTLEECRMEVVYGAHYELIQAIQHILYYNYSTAAIMIQPDVQSLDRDFGSISF